MKTNDNQSETKDVENKISELSESNPMLHDVLYKLFYGVEIHNLDLFFISRNEGEIKHLAKAISDITSSSYGARILSNTATEDVLLKILRQDYSTVKDYRTVKYGHPYEGTFDALEAIRNISNCAHRKGIFTNEETKDVLLEILRRTNHHEVKYQAMLVVINICERLDGEEFFANEETKDLLLEILRTANDDDLKTMTVGAIAAITNSTDGKKIFANEKTKDVLLEILRTIDNHEVRYQTIKAIENITYSSAGQTIFADKKMVNILSKILGGSNNDMVRVTKNILSNIRSAYQEKFFANEETKDILAEHQEQVAQANDINEESPALEDSESDQTPQSQLQSIQSQYDSANVELENQSNKIRELEQIIKKNQSDSAVTISPANQEKLNQALKDLESIDPKFKLTPDAQAEQSHILSNPVLKEYYQQVQKGFNEAFIAAAAISTNEFRHQSSSVVRALEASSKLVSPLPFALAVTAGAAATADATFAARRAGQFNNISNLIPNSSPIDAEILARKLAHRLTMTNEEEIKNVSQGIDRQDKLKGIKGFLHQAQEQAAAIAKNQLGKLDNALAKGVFGEDLSPAQLLAFDNSKKALDYVMGQSQAEIDQTKSDINLGKQEEVIDRIVENAINKRPLKLVPPIPTPNNIPQTQQDEIDNLPRNIQEVARTEIKGLSKEEIEYIKKKFEEENYAKKTEKTPKVNKTTLINELVTLFDRDPSQDNLTPIEILQKIKSDSTQPKDSVSSIYSVKHLSSEQEMIELRKELEEQKNETQYLKESFSRQIEELEESFSRRIAQEKSQPVGCCVVS